jgi:DNA-binding transcriptional LysR family regulator
MDADDLRVFEAVARLGGMNRAAAELHTVQSNVTSRIRALEEDLGVELFTRHARGVSATPAAHRLLPYAAKMRDLLRDARRAACDDGTPAGPLVIGTLETTAAIRLSPQLAAFVKQYPQVDLSLRTGTTCELIEQTLTRQVDGAFVCGPVEHPDLLAETMFREELVALTAIGTTLDALINQGEVRIIVLRAGCSYRQRLEDILARRGAVGVRILQFGTLEAIIGCVAAGLGLTLLPRSIAETARHAGQLAVHALPPRDAFVETVFVRHRDGYIPAALSAFIDTVNRRSALAQAAE